MAIDSSSKVVKQWVGHVLSFSSEYNNVKLNSLCFITRHKISRN